MSEEYKTVEEYTRDYAKKYNMTPEQAEQCIAVSLFKEYAQERDKIRGTERE